MRRAIRKHTGEVMTVLALAVLALGVAGYILDNQRVRFPLLEDPPFRVELALPNAQAVQPGQGQTVRVAGVRVGDIGDVRLEDGLAIVELELDPEYEGLVRRDASALLRSRTGLKDMFVELDPGVGEPLPEGARIPVAGSQDDVDPDEFLAALDRDTRDYLKLLISGAGKGLEGRGSDLRETFARLGPLHRDLDRVSSAFARRRENLRRLVASYGTLTTELGRADRDIVRLVRGSSESLRGFAEADEDISAAVAALPGALRETRTTLDKVDPFAARLAPALESLRPAFRRLDDANAALLPLAREGAPIVRDEVRPFARAAQPFTTALGTAGRDLGRANPDLASAFAELNRFFNIGAYNPGGADELTGDLARDRARNEGYLYWLGHVAQSSVSVFSSGDAQGPFRRLSVDGLSCALLPAGAIRDALGNAEVCSE